MTDSFSERKYEGSLNDSTNKIMKIKGAQDFYMAAEKEIHRGWNNKKYWLSKPHKYKYEYIGCFGGTPDKNKKISMTIPPRFHMISDLDLIIDHDSNYNIENAIKIIEVEIGGQRIDRLSSMREVDLNCQIINSSSPTNFARKVTTTHNKDGTCTTFIPLELAPFHSNELFLLGSLYRHDVKLNIQFGDFPVTDAEIWGKTYYFGEDVWKLFTQLSQEVMTIQSQFTGEENVILGEPNKIHLCFNHPVTCIYFWGIDKQLIKNIKLLLNGIDYIDTTPKMLDHISKQRGIERTDDSLIIFLNDGDITKPYSWLNFSNIDNATLILNLDESTTDELNGNVRIVALSHQSLRIMNGMAGLSFSK